MCDRMWNIKSFFSHILPLVCLCKSRYEIEWTMLHVAARKGQSASTANAARVSAEDLYSRPEGAPALCDDPSELGQPPGVHLKPLQRVIPPSTPGPIVEVVFVEASLWAQNTFSIPEQPASTQTPDALGFQKSHCLHGVIKMSAWWHFIKDLHQPHEITTSMLLTGWRLRTQRIWHNRIVTLGHRWNGLFTCWQQLVKATL